MRRLGLIVAAGLVLLFLVALFWPTPANRYQPCYLPGRAPATNHFTSVDYGWLTARPFENDRVWIVGRENQTNYSFLQYDLRERRVLGKLADAWVELANGDGTKLLVVGPDAPAVTFKFRLLQLLQKISGGKITPNADRTESFWVLNLTNNATRRVGAVTQFAGTGSRWCTSPNLRYGATMPTTEFDRAFVLFDFATDTFARIPCAGYLCGWWDDQNVILQTAGRDYLLVNVARPQTNLLFSAATLRQTLEQFQLPSDPTNVQPFAHWTGTNYDLYFAEMLYEHEGKRCFLLKADRTTSPPTLQLVAREFQFRWGGQFNARATHYVYQGESGAVGRGGNGAVLLRDLRDSSERTLVPPDDRGQYAIPRFYGDEIIYFRDRQLWRIGLDGSNNTPLFPAATNAAAVLPAKPA